MITPDTPVARDAETLVHLHFTDPMPSAGQVAIPRSRSTWIGTSISRRLRRDEDTGRMVLDVTIDVDCQPLCERCHQRTAVWDSELCEPCQDAAIQRELSCDWLPDESEAAR